LFLGAFIAWSIYQEYSGIDAAERGRLSARAKIIDENMMRQLDATNRMLGGIRNDLPYLDKKKDGLERLIHRLKFLMDAMPGVRFIAVLDAQGRIIAANQEEFIGQNFRHRDYFQAPLRDPNPDMLYISPPFRNVSGIITMGLSRAIIAPGGRFAGVVMASLEPEEFRILMNSVRYAPDMQASLIHGGGVVFMGIPEQEGLVGMDMAAKPDSLFNRHIKSGQAASVISGMVSAAGEERVMALRTSQPAALRMNKPMVIAISRDLPAVFAGWRREAWQLGGLFCTLMLISGAGLFAYQRRQRDYNRLVASHEAERRKAAERLKLATEAAGIGVWEYDLVNGALFWDDSMFAIYGMAPEKFSADYMTWRNSLLPEDVAETEAATRPAIEQGKPYDICFRIRRGDGQVRTIRALAQVNFDESGKAVRMVGINEDITERKQAEDALANSENRFREIFDTVSDAIFIHDAETGRILDVNRRMLEMYVLSREQALACGPDDLSAGVPPYSSAEAIKKIRLAQSAGPQTFEWLARARDGRFFWVEVSLRFASIGGRGARYFRAQACGCGAAHCRDRLRVTGWHSGYECR
jgi:PAS domain S-box-containing protein